MRSIHFYSCFTDKKNRGLAGLCDAEITQGGERWQICTPVLGAELPATASRQPQTSASSGPPRSCPLPSHRASAGQPLLRLRSLKHVSQGPLAFSSAPALEGAGGQSGGLQGRPASMEQHAEALMAEEVTQGMAQGRDFILILGQP